MRTYFLLLALPLFIAAQAQTTQRNWDVRLAISGGTHPYLQDGGHFLRLNIFTPEFEERDAYTADILHQTKNPKIKIGLAASYIKINQYHLAGWSWSGSTSDETHVMATQKITTVMPAFNYSYLLRKKSQLYSQVCLGAAFTAHRFYDDKARTEHTIDPAFQCTFLGYRLGRRIGFFSELGYGYKGILQLGISGTF